MTQRDERMGFWQVMGSVLAALLGVQSEKNRQRRFHQWQPLCLHRSRRGGHGGVDWTDLAGCAAVAGSGRASRALKVIWVLMAPANLR